MLTIKFYKISDNPKKLTKALGDVIYTRDAEILSSCSIHDPSFVLLYHSALLEANYFKVEQWNAYYFMNEPTVSPGGRCIVSGVKDVLFSNRDQILALEAYCIRCESNKTRMLIDPSVPSLVTTNVTTLNLDKTPFNGIMQYLLTVKGGKVQQNGGV